MRTNDRLRRLEALRSSANAMPIAEIEAALDRFESEGAASTLPRYDRHAHIGQLAALPGWRQRHCAAMLPSDWLL